MTTLINKDTGWFRHCHGGRDTADMDQAVWLTDSEVAGWKRAFSPQYRFLTEAEAEEHAKTLGVAK